MQSTTIFGVCTKELLWKHCRYISSMVLVWTFHGLKILYTIFWQTNTGILIVALQNTKNKIKLQMYTVASGVLKV